MGYSVTALAAACAIVLLAVDSPMRKAAAIGAMLATLAFSVPLGLGLWADDKGSF